MPEACDPTARREQSKVEPVTGEKSEPGSRIGRCGWITSFLRKNKYRDVFYCLVIKFQQHLLMHLLNNRIFLVAMRFGDTPVPIPNTMVKTKAADGTALETVWESRWLPDPLGM